MRKFGISQVVLQSTIVGQQQQTFAVLIETANGIDAFNRDVVPERPCQIRAAELTQHSIWFVERDISMLQSFAPATPLYIVSPAFFRQLSPGACAGYSAVSCSSTRAQNCPHK